VTAARDPLAVLRARAQKLALVESAARDVVQLPHVAFIVGGHGLAVPLADVVYAGRLRHLTSVPGAEPFVLGVTALSGHVVTVLDAAALLRLPRRGLCDIGACLVVRSGNRKLGLGADQLLGIEDIPSDCIKDFPSGGAEIPRVALLPERQLLLLALAPLFSDPRLSEDEG
jgi:chemotaxis signal transduction protein